MAERELIEEGLALLSITIGTIMEDEVDAAVSALPTGAKARADHFRKLRQAGQDIEMLAVAAEVLLRRC